MNEEVLRGLLDELGELESEIKALEYRKEEIRNQVFKIVDELPTKSVEVLGLGTALITKPSVTVKYDSDKLDSLVAELIRNGEIHTAQKISDVREEKPRKGSLMIRKAKY
jgi:hypothetical protein